MRRRQSPCSGSWSGNTAATGVQLTMFRQAARKQAWTPLAAVSQAPERWLAGEQLSECWMAYGGGGVSVSWRCSALALADARDHTKLRLLIPAPGNHRVRVDRGLLFCRKKTSEASPISPDPRPKGKKSGCGDCPR